MSRVSLLKILCGFICVSMTCVTVVTSLKSNLFVVLPIMIHDPWTLATLIDFYFNILIIWAWVVYRERRFAVSVAWLLAFIALGSIATSGYVLLQLFALKPVEGLDSLFLRKT